MPCFALPFPACFALQFDAPDRLFNSMADTWKGVCTNPADLKVGSRRHWLQPFLRGVLLSQELIPEFYDGGGDFLVNAKNLDLGTRQDGGKVRRPLASPCFVGSLWHQTLSLPFASGWGCGAAAMGL